MEKGVFVKITILFVFSFFTLSVFAVTPVKITFMEALAPKDTTSSERFQKEYEYAVQTAKDLTKKRLEKCGYEISDEKLFYDASDTLQALEKAKKAQADGAWLVVGPRRSNHYLLVAQGADTTATISIMASAKEIYELDSLHLTLGQSNIKMAETLANETIKNFKNKKQITYVSVVSEDCVTCIDFADSFNKTASKLKYKKLDEIKITGEQPELTGIEEKIKKLKPDVVLLPNYSKVSAYLIGAIHRWNPNTFFIGGDGWGDNKYGFVHNSPQLENANGITVKGFPTVDKGLSYFDLGIEILKNPTLASAFPASGSAQALLKVVESTVDLICSHKPKNKSEFTNIFKENGAKFFKNPWGVSIFRLSNGEVVYDKTIK